MMKSYDETKYNTFYLSSKAETIINESDIDDAFESICSSIISNIQKSLEKVRVGFDAVVDHTINISKYKFLSSSS